MWFVGDISAWTPQVNFHQTGKSKQPEPFSPNYESQKLQILG